MLVGDALLREIVALLVYGIVETLTQFFVVDFVAVLAFLGLASLYGEFGNDAALGLDGLVCGFEGAEHYVFANFFHLAFHHHNVLFGGSDDEVEVGTLDVLHWSIDDILAVKVAYADLADGAVEGYVADGESRSCCEGSQLVGHCVLVARDEGYLHLHFSVEVVGEERTQSAVNQSGNENFVLRRTCLAFEETAGRTAHSGIFLLVIYGEGHKVHEFTYFFLCAYRSEKHSVVHTHYGAAVSLLCKLAGLDFDHSAIAEIEFLVDNVHFLLLFPYLSNNQHGERHVVPLFGSGCFIKKKSPRSTPVTQP